MLFVLWWLVVLTIGIILVRVLLRRIFFSWREGYCDQGKKRAAGEYWSHACVCATAIYIYGCFAAHVL